MKKALWGWKWKLADLTNKPVQISGSFDMESLALAHTGHLTSTGLAADLSESLHAARPQVALHCQAKFCTSTVQSANGNIKPGCSTALLPVKLLEFLLAALHRDAPRPELRTDFGILPSVDLGGKKSTDFRTVTLNVLWFLWSKSKENRCHVYCMVTIHQSPMHFREQKQQYSMLTHVTYGLHSHWTAGPFFALLSSGAIWSGEKPPVYPLCVGYWFLGCHHSWLFS